MPDDSLNSTCVIGDAGETIIYLAELLEEQAVTRHHQSIVDTLSIMYDRHPDKRSSVLWAMGKAMPHVALPWIRLNVLPWLVDCNDETTYQTLIAMENLYGAWGSSIAGPPDAQHFDHAYIAPLADMPGRCGEVARRILAKSAT